MIQFYNKLVTNYCNSAVQFNRAKFGLLNNERLIKNVFKDKYPNYYIYNLDISNRIRATICRKSDGKIVDSNAFLQADGSWVFKKK